jgi:hypothetical protein
MDPCSGKQVVACLKERAASATSGAPLLSVFTDRKGGEEIKGITEPETKFFRNVGSYKSHTA